MARLLETLRLRCPRRLSARGRRPFFGLPFATEGRHPWAQALSWASICRGNGSVRGRPREPSRWAIARMCRAYGRPFPRPPSTLPSFPTMTRPSLSATLPTTRGSSWESLAFLQSRGDATFLQRRGDATSVLRSCNFWKLAESMQLPLLELRGNSETRPCFGSRFGPTKKYLDPKSCSRSGREHLVR